MFGKRRRDDVPLPDEAPSTSKLMRTGNEDDHCVIIADCRMTGNPATLIHPLLVDHIIEQIFEYLFWPGGKPPEPKLSPVKMDHGEVQRIRLVCKQWNEVGTRLFRRHRKPLYLGGSASNQMTRFLDVMEASSVVPIDSYGLGPQIFTSVGSKNQFLEFLYVCGPPLVKLEISIHCSSSSFDISSFPEIHLPCLKYLRFTLKWDEFATSSHEEGVIRFLLKAATNLHELGFQILLLGDPFFGVLLCESLLTTVILNLPPSTKVLCFNNVHMGGGESCELFSLLIARKLRLSKFLFRWNGRVSPESVMTLLETQATTLKQLELATKFAPRNRNYTFTVPPLPQLEELVVRDLKIELPPIAEGFPRLWKLNLSEWHRNEEDACLQFLQANRPTKPDEPPLRELFLPGFATAKLVTTVGVRFPNIRELSFCPVVGSLFSEFSEVVRAIFEHCLNLEVLHLTFEPPSARDDVKNMDSLLSGLPGEDCVRLISRRGGFGKVDLSELRTHPSLANLMKLRRLELVNRRGTQFPIVTRFTGELVFVPMKSLVHLRVDSLGYQQKLSKKLRGLLDAKFNATRLSGRTF